MVNRTNLLSTHTTLHQINLHKSKYANYELFKQTEPLRNVIILAQEPHAYNGKITGTPRGLKARTVGPSPRSCIIHPIKLNITPISELCSEDVVSCLWETESSTYAKIMLISVYWDITIPVIPYELVSSISYCHNHNLPYICSMDSNAHSTLWGCNNDNPRGKTLEEFIIRMGADLQNRGNAPTFSNHRSATIIDLTFTDPSLSNALSNWRIHDTPSLSDHVAIRMNLHLSTPPASPIRIWKTADWQLFKSLLQNLPPLPLTWNETNIESECSLLHTLINNALDIACPKTILKPTQKLLWWNSSLDNSRRRAHRYHNHYHKRPTEENKTLFNQARRSHQRQCRKARRESWKTFVSGSNTQKSAALLSKIVQKKFNSNTIGHMKLPDGSSTSSTKATLETLVDEHFPGNSVIEPPLPPLSPAITLQSIPWITDKLISQAIHSFKKDKAAGPDDFKPILLQNLPPIVISRLNTLFTACISLGYTPTPWKTSKTIFIPKNGKTCYQDPRSFRPISLTSFFFKTLEKLMLWEAEQSCLLTSPMHDNQHAFRKDHSCDIALSRVVGHIEKSILNGHYTLGVFLDIQGAFDNITIDSLESGMRAHGFPEQMITWYINYMKTRSCQSTLFDSTIVRFLNKGTPQGGVFSPIAWNLAFDSLLKLFDRSNVLIIGFADDGTILISGPDPTTLVHIAQEALNKISRWGIDHGLTFSPSKTNAVLFHRKYKSPESTLPSLTLDGSIIKYTTTVKYLGVLLDYKLKWTPHIEDKIAKAKKSLLLHRNAMGKLWGPHPSTVRWLYEGIIKPSLTYGCLVWGHALTTQSITLKLQRLQRLALLPMSPVRSQTPTAGMEVLANITPLTVTIKELSSRAYLRIKPYLTNWDDLGRGNLRGHLHHVKKRVGDLNLDLNNLDKIPPTFQPKNSLNIIVSDFGSTPPPPPNSLLFYTDGSKTPEGIGAGFAVYQMDTAQRSFNLIHSDSFKLPSYATVFQAEVEAINQGARFALDITTSTPNNLSLYGDLSHHELYFIGDNRASLIAISNNLAKSRTVLNCSTNLSLLNRTHKITLHWIKAHSGQEGNERADHLAKQGTLIPIPPNPPPNIPNLLPTPIPLSHVKNMCKHQSLKLWNHQWANSQHCRQTKIFFPEVDVAKSNHLLRLNRDHFGRAIRWLTGHCFLNRHNNLLHPTETTDPQCRLCQMDVETSSHIICQCEALCLVRHYHFQEFLLPLSPITYIKQLTSYLDDPRIHSLEYLPHE